MFGAHYFYQVSEEEITRAQTLAGMLEIPFPHAIGIAIVVKRAAIRVSGATGAIPGEAAAWCAAQVGWPQHDARRLLDALLCAGHVLAIAGPSLGHSVAFTEPLKAMEETSKKRSDAGRKGAEARKSKGGYGRAMAGPQPGDSHGVARDGKKEKETEMENQKDLSLPPPAGASAVPEQRSLLPTADGDSGGEWSEDSKRDPAPNRRKGPATPRKAAAEPKTTDPRHAPLVKALTDAGYPFRGGRDAAAVSDLLRLADQREETRGELAGLEVMRRARIGWEWAGYPCCKSLTELRDNWGHYERDQSAARPRDVTRGVVRAEDMHHSGPGDLTI